MNTLKIETKNAGEFCVYALSGPFTVSTLVPLREKALKDISQKKIFFAFDLSGLTAIDSSAMGLLINLHKKTGELRGQVVLYALSAAVRPGIEQAGLQQILAVVRDEAEFRDNFLL